MLNLFLIFFSSINGDINSKKVLICGVCKDVEFALNNAIQNIELLAINFDECTIIIYENNSSDNTASILSKWSKNNQKVIFLSETLSKVQLPQSRTERIARARNKVLSVAKAPEYADFDYLIMVDLDFTGPWPIEEILNTLDFPMDWDCISANGTRNGNYWDRYAFRNQSYPFGPELLGESWWEDLKHSWFALNEDDLLPVYSAFGGLAIYKYKSIIQFSYSGIATEELKKYYEKIIFTLPLTNPGLKKYLNFIKMPNADTLSSIPIKFITNSPIDHAPNYQIPTCCEHVTLHAKMTLSGYGKFFVNPRMVIEY